MPRLAASLISRDAFVDHHVAGEGVGGLVVLRVTAAEVQEPGAGLDQRELVGGVGVLDDRVKAEVAVGGGEDVQLGGGGGGEKPGGDMPVVGDCSTDVIRPRIRRTDEGHVGRGGLVVVVAVACRVGGKDAARADGQHVGVVGELEAVVGAVKGEGVDGVGVGSGAGERDRVSRGGPGVVRSRGQGSQRLVRGQRNDPGPPR